MPDTPESQAQRRGPEKAALFIVYAALFTLAASAVLGVYSLATWVF